MQQSQEQTTPATKSGAHTESGHGTETASGHESALPSESSKASKMWPPDSPCLITCDIRPGSAPAKLLFDNDTHSSPPSVVPQMLLGPGVDELLDPEASDEIISSYELLS